MDNKFESNIADELYFEDVKHTIFKFENRRGASLLEFLSNEEERYCLSEVVFQFDGDDPVYDIANEVYLNNENEVNEQLSRLYSGKELDSDISVREPLHFSLV